ncbi:MAG: molecular chaperone [Acidobacteria bacterium]|nr:MAG: molecular chaperone [Acidobacteriota bacterium]
MAEMRTDREQPPRTEREKGGEIARRQSSTGLGLWRDPFSMLNDFDREVHRLFEGFGLGATTDTWSPQIEMYQRDNKLIIRADLPGLNKNDVKVELNDNILTIEGERKQEKRDERGGWSERSYGHFLRSIALPEGASGENCNATFKDGVLEITCDAPQRQQQRGRQIEIK